MDDQLALALEISKREAEEAELKRLKEQTLLGTRPIQFNAQNFGGGLLQGFKSLFLSPLFSWSDTFRAMLENETWRESQQQELQIHIEEAEYPIFKLMLQYMYTGSISVTNENILVLIALTNYYAVNPLKEACGAVLGAQLNDDNVFQLLEICEKYSCTKLRQMCAEFLASNFEELLVTNKMMELDPETWAEMLKSDDIRVGSEEIVFTAVMKYSEKFSGDKKSKVLETILPSVRFPHLSMKTLLERVESDPVLQKIPIVHSLLHETYKYKAYPQGVKTPRTKPRKGFAEFDKERKPVGVTISEDGHTATLSTYSSGGWQTMNILPAFSDDAERYIEVKVNFIGSGGVFVGVGSTTQTGMNIGSLANSCGWQSTGAVYRDGLGSTNTLQNYVAQDRIGIKCVPTRGGKQFSFYKNGKKLWDVPNTYTCEMFPQVTFYSVNDSFTILSSASPEN